MFRRLSGATAMALVLTGAAFAQDHDHDHDDDHHDVTLYRVFVGDHQAGRVTAFDLTEPDHRWTFQTTGQPRLYGIANGAAVAAVQSDNDTVQFFASGIELHDHGDHSDIEIADPAAIGTALTGPRPFHLVDHGAKVVINYDKGGYAEILDGHELSHGHVEVTKFPQSEPHHGFVAPLGKHWLSSVAPAAPADGGEAPPRLGLQEFTIDGAPVGDLATCTAIHGEAFSGAYLAAGCKEGVLTVTAGAEGPVFKMLEYPADLPQGVTTGTLLGSTGIQVFLGNYGPNGLVVIDPVDEPHFRHIALPFRRVDFALDPAKPAQGYVLTEDGTLHRIDLLKAEIAASAKVTQPYSMDGHWNDPRPRIAVAGDEIVLSDPNAGLVRRISTETLAEVGTVPVEGKPYNLTVVGGSGVVHEGEDHDHAGHSHGDPQIYAGIFEDSQVADRTLSDYEGDWQSVYPFLQDGTLDPIWEHKAAKGKASVEEYRAEYETGYRTDVERITIDGDLITFYRNGEPAKAHYAYDGHEILTYAAGNRGVRFIFSKTEGDEAAPQFVQFSDHRIAPAKADHYHIYWGNDRAALLEEVTNWPTYYPSALDADEIVKEMLAH